MRLAKLAPLISRLGCLVLVALLLLIASRAVTTGELPEFSLWLYAARLSLWTALVIAVPAALLFALETRVPRGRIVATGALWLGLLPLVQPSAAYLASGDGLRARGISAALLEGVALLILLSVSAAVWTYRYWARSRALDLGLGALFFCGVLGCAALLSRTQLELAALLQVHALALAVLVLHVGFAARGALLLRVAVASLLLVAGLLVTGLALPAQLARGRRLSLLTESGVGLLAAQLVPAAPERALAAPTPAVCDRVLAPPTLPGLDLPMEQRRNVIVITIDTVRADYVQRLRPDGTLLMPALARFMSESRRATRAHAAFPATMMSLAAAFSGNMPTDLLLTPRPYPTLVQLTRDRFDHREVILPSGHYFSRPDVQALLLPDLEVTSRGAAHRQTRYAIQLLRSLRAEGKSHFIWLHYFDPHEPYNKHDPYDFGDSDEQRYASELAYVDDSLAPVLELLRDGGWYDDSLIALFSDHGESFGEHQHHHHHYLVYSWLVSVPFALHAPGLAPGAFEGPVHLMDLTPTVLQFLGVAPTRPLRGLPLLAADPPRGRPLFSEEISINGRILLGYRERPVASQADVLERMWSVEHGRGYVSKLAVAQDGLQLVQHRNSRAAGLFDMERDPRAEHDLAEAQPDHAQALADVLARLRRDMLMRSMCELAGP